MARETQGLRDGSAVPPFSVWAYVTARSAASRMATISRGAVRLMAEAPSGEADLGGPLVLPAVGVQEGDPDGSWFGGLQGEGEERVLADGLARVGLQDLAAVVRHNHLMDELVVLVDGLPVLPLDDLHGMDHETPNAHHVPPLDTGGDPDPDPADLGHDASPFCSPRGLP